MSRIFHHDSFEKKRRERIQVIVILSIVFFCLLSCAGLTEADEHGIEMVACSITLQAFISSNNTHIRNKTAY